MRDRKLNSVRALEAEAVDGIPLIAYNPGTMTDPLPAVERTMEAFRRRVRGNPVLAYGKVREVLADLRSLAAETFGGTPGNWAMADGHTATIDRIASILPEVVGVGATVVSTYSEHVGGLGAFQADPRFRVVTVEPGRLVDTPGQIFFVSHLTYDTNRDLSPEIRALIRRPDRPIVIVDGSQALGQIPLDIGWLGCHAYLSSAHKWLGGPHGTGLLFLRDDVVEAWPTPFRAGVPLCPALPIGRWEPRGGQDFSRVAGLAAAVRAYQCHAKPSWELRDLFILTLEGVLGDLVRISEESAPYGRVVAFELADLDVYPVYRELGVRGLVVKCIKRSGGESAVEVLRVGFPWWVEDARVEEAVGILADVLSRPPFASVEPTAQPRAARAA